jgi:uncharacterized membrane protein YgdD (TMEM256/DUF423 family)
MNRRTTTLVAGFLGMSAVAAGAFGAHGLRAVVEPRDLEIWSTGAHYQLVHAVALLALAAWQGAESKALRTAALLWTIGSLVFAGTLYAMVLGAPRWLGAVTPLGGLCLMAGWAAVAVHGWGQRGMDDSEQ